MALIKTISAKIKDGQIVSPQRHVEMHPLEEASVLAHWKVGEITSAMPQKPTQSDEHEWLIEHGAEYVKAKREVYQDAYAKALPALTDAQNAHQAAVATWHAHINKCEEQGLDPDTTPST